MCMLDEGSWLTTMLIIFFHLDLCKIESTISADAARVALPTDQLRLLLPDLHHVPPVGQPVLQLLSLLDSLHLDPQADLLPNRLADLPLAPLEDQLLNQVGSQPLDPLEDQLLYQLNSPHLDPLEDRPLNQLGHQLLNRHEIQLLAQLGLLLLSPQECRHRNLHGDMRERAPKLRIKTTSDFREGMPGTGGTEEGSMKMKLGTPQYWWRTR